VARGSTSYHKWEGNKTYTSLLGAEVANILPHQLCLFPTVGIYGVVLTGSQSIMQ